MTENIPAEDFKKEFTRQILFLILGELLVAGLTCVVFLLIKRFEMKVLWGALLGAVLAVGNYVSMAFSLSLASKRAVEGDIKGGQVISTASMIGRYLLLALILFFVARTKAVNPIALVVPLALFRVILTVGEMIRSKEEKTS